MTSQNGHKRLILYRRVSTDDQADKGYSLPDQLRDCRQYAESHGITAIEGDAESAFAEDFTGAAQMDHRPVGRRVDAMLRRGSADGIIFHRIDRISRDLVDGLVLIRDYTRSGFDIHVCDYGQIKDETDIKLLIELWGADKERKRILDRTTRGKREKARSGKIVGSGFIPYGYGKTGEKKDAALTTNESEAEIVRLIFTWYLRGDGDNKPMSGYAIARRLSEMGIPAPGVTRVHQRKRMATAWNLGTVLNILQNEVYTGVWHYGEIGVPVPSIVSRKLWEEAQTRREFNARLSHHNKATRQYLLSGMIRCSCGRAMSGNSMQGATGELRYYRCPERTYRHVGLEIVNCGRSPVNAGAVESVAWEYVLDVITEPMRFEDALRKAQAAELDAVQPKRDRLQIVQDMIAEAEREASKLAQALVKASGVVGDALQRQIDDVNGRHAKLMRERDRLQAEIEAGALTDAQIEQAMHYRRDVIEGLKHATFEDKREMFKLLQIEVTIRGYMATVRCRVPVGAEPREIDLKDCSGFVCPARRRGIEADRIPSRPIRPERTEAAGSCRERHA